MTRRRAASSLAAGAVARASRSCHPCPGRSAPAVRRSPSRPPRARRACARWSARWGSPAGSAGDMHERLCPLLRDIARDRLADGGHRPRPRSRDGRGGPRAGGCGSSCAPTARRRATATARAPRCADVQRAVDQHRADRRRAVSGDLALEQVSTPLGRPCSTRWSGPLSASAPELEIVLLAILADGHVLIEDYPGLAKTLVARSFAQVLDLELRAHPVHARPPARRRHRRRRSTARATATFEFRPGPVFTNLLLADEINRAPPKTQSALLEAMAERQVTIEGETRIARAAVPRHRDPEPDRVRGHLPAARGAARPLPGAGPRSATRRATTSGRCSSAGASG